MTPEGCAPIRRAPTMAKMAVRRITRRTKTETVEIEAKQRQLIKSLHGSIGRNLVLAGKDAVGSRRARIYRLLERPDSSKLGMIVLGTIMLCLVASVFVYFMASISDEVALHPLIIATEYVCTTVFTLELLTRVYVGTLDPYRQILCDVTLWIDAASVTPFYVEKLPFFMNGDNYKERAFLQFLQLLRLLRVLKLVSHPVHSSRLSHPPSLMLSSVCTQLRHYSGWRVLLIALERSWRAIMVPAFAMLVTIFMLSGLLFAIESVQDTRAQQQQQLSVEAQQQQQLLVDSAAGNITSPSDVYKALHALWTAPEETVALENAFESMWVVFWLVTTLGYDGNLGTQGAASQLVIAVALLCGLLLTTMPITIIGGAFASAWEQKEVSPARSDRCCPIKGIALSSYKLPAPNVCCY